MTTCKIRCVSRSQTMSLTNINIKINLSRLRVNTADEQSLSKTNRVVYSNMTAECVHCKHVNYHMYNADNKEFLNITSTGW